MYLQRVAESPCESFRDDSYHEMTADFDVHLTTAGRSMRGGDETIRESIHGRHSERSSNHAVQQRRTPPVARSGILRG